MTLCLLDVLIDAIIILALCACTCSIIESVLFNYEGDKPGLGGMIIPQSQIILINLKVFVDDDYSDK